MKTKKVFFDVKSGKLAAEGVDDCLVFSNQAKVLAEDGVLGLYSPEGKKVLSGFLYCYVFESGLCHVMFSENKHHVYDLNGKCLIDGANDVVFYQGGWFTARKNDVLNLYTPQGDLVSHDIKSVEVTSPEGKFAVTQAEDGYLVLYNQKGLRYAYGFINFKGGDDAFILDYDYETLMIDPVSFAETRLLAQSVIVLRHNKFMGISLLGKQLYHSSGRCLLSDYMDYEVYANGMYRGLDYPGTPNFGKRTDVLYINNRQVVLNDVVDVIEHENGCLEVLVEKGCHLYDSKGQHMAFLDEDEALGNCLEDNCFTLIENGKNVLYLADKTKVAEDVDEVSVFECGLILTEKKNQLAEKSFWSLFDVKGNLLCSSEGFISVDGTYGYYVVETDEDNIMSVCKGDKEVLSDLSDVFFTGRLMFAEDDEGEVFVYDLSLGLDEPIWQGSSSEDVVLCDLETDMERFWKRNS